MKTSAYFYGQVKRILKLFPRIFLLSVVFAVVIGVCGMLYAGNSNYTKDTAKYDIGILCTSDNELVTLGLKLIRNLDDSRYMVNIISFDSEEAGFDALHANEISAFAVIPDEFIDAMMYLDETPHIKLYTASQKGITTVFMNEVADVISNDVVYAEAGIYSFADSLYGSDVTYDRASVMIDTLFYKYMTALFNRGEVSEVTELGLGNGLSLLGYFFCGLVLFYTVMLSFCCISYFTGKRTEFFMISASKGVGPVGQVLSEYVCFFAANLLCAVFTLICVYFVLTSGLVGFGEFEENPLKSYLAFSGCYIFVLMALTAFEFMLFEVISGVINKFLMPFIVLIGFSFLSGYFYPKSFLPKVAQTIGDVLPTGVAYKVLAAGLTGKDNVLNVLFMFVYALAFLAAVVYARKIRIEKGTD